MDFSGKLYLVTGASVDSDIGFAICKKLDELGATLILVSRREASLKDTAQQLTANKHHICPFDLSKLDEIPIWVNNLVKQYGAVDGLIHSASYQGYSPLRGVTGQQISNYFDINFSAAVMLTSSLSKARHFNPNASFVFIGSAAGVRGLKARTLYAASKAALHSLVRSAALELASKSIRVNCVAPAVVSGAKAEKQFEILGEAQTKILIDAHPLGLSKPEDVANSVSFLLSDLSAKTTGMTLTVDGGFLAG